MCVGSWLASAVQVLKDGDLASDAADLAECCAGLSKGSGKPMGGKIGGSVA